MKRFTTGNVYYGHDVMQKIYSQQPRGWTVRHANIAWGVVCVVAIAAVALGFLAAL